MKKLKILVKSFKLSELIVFILCPWEYMHFNIMDIRMDIILHTDKKQQILKKKLKFEQILEPEIISFFSDNYTKELAGLYVVSDLVKIKSLTSAYNEWNCMEIICKNAVSNIIEKKRYDKQELNQIFLNNREWNIFKEGKFILHTNLIPGKEYLLNIIGRTIHEVSIFCHLEVNQPITYYVTDELLYLYMISKKFPILTTNYLTAEDKVLMLLNDNQYVKNIITHETVHALLYQNGFHNREDKFAAWQINCMEGYCQYVMNSLCAKKDAYIRFFTALKVLNISNANELREKALCADSNELNSSIIQYEILPCIFEEWGKNFKLKDLFIDFYNEKEMGDKIIKSYSMIIRNNKVKKTIRIDELYADTYSQFISKIAEIDDTEDYHMCVSQYRKEIDRLRYKDYSK